MTTPNYKRPWEDMHHKERCPLCFAEAPTNQGIGNVMLCHPCFALFNQTTDMPLCCFLDNSTEAQWKEVVKETRKEYLRRKSEYLARLEKNVDAFLQEEDEMLDDDADQMAEYLHSRFELLQAEHKVEQLKNKRR